MSDAQTAANIGAYTGCLGLIIALLTAAISYGVLQSKVEEMKERQAKLEEMLDDIDDRYVSYRTFDTIISQVREALNTIQSDIRGIQNLLTRWNRSDFGRDDS